MVSLVSNQVLCYIDNMLENAKCQVFSWYNKYTHELELSYQLRVVMELRAGKK